MEEMIFRKKNHFYCLFYNGRNDFSQKIISIVKKTIEEAIFRKKKSVLLSFLQWK
jgi:hypothetical protein